MSNNDSWFSGVSQSNTRQSSSMAKIQEKGNFFFFFCTHSLHTAASACGSCGEHAFDPLLISKETSSQSFSKSALNCSFEESVKYLTWWSTSSTIASTSLRNKLTAAALFFNPHACRSLELEEFGITSCRRLSAVFLCCVVCIQVFRTEVVFPLDANVRNVGGMLGLNFECLKKEKPQCWYKCLTSFPANACWSDTEGREEGKAMVF